MLECPSSVIYSGPCHTWGSQGVDTEMEFKVQMIIRDQQRGKEKEAGLGWSNQLFWFAWDEGFLGLRTFGTKTRTVPEKKMGWLVNLAKTEVEMWYKLIKASANHSGSSIVTTTHQNCPMMGQDCWALYLVFLSPSAGCSGKTMTVGQIAKADSEGTDRWTQLGKKSFERQCLSCLPQITFCASVSFICKMGMMMVNTW